jgi:hypothetical protein
MNRKVKKVLTTLVDLKDQFFSGSDWSWEKSIGVTEVNDYLDGITVGNDDNYIENMFSKLNDDEKHYIFHNLPNGIIWLDFDNLYATYEL